MLNQRASECLRECSECAAACLQCATECGEVGDRRAMRRCITLDMQCADICYFAAASIARGDQNMQAVCSLCADACQTCGSECTKHTIGHCQRCAEICQCCADACRGMLH